MAFGCVFTVTYSPPGATLQVGDIVVLPCSTPCTDQTIGSGQDAGCNLQALDDECMDYPPEGRAQGGSSPDYEEIQRDYGTVFRKSL